MTPARFTKYPTDLFDTTIHAGIIYKSWKLLTGDPGNGQFGVNQSAMPNPYPSVQLFKYLSDPQELNNLADRYPHVVEKLLRMLAGYYNSSPPARSIPLDRVRRSRINSQLIVILAC